MVVFGSLKLFFVGATVNQVGRGLSGRRVSLLEGIERYFRKERERAQIPGLEDCGAEQEMREEMKQKKEEIK